MRIDDYFAQIRAMLTNTVIVQTSVITYDIRGPFEGYMRGELNLVDGSTLHVREYVDVEQVIERLTYAYHYVAADGALVFRYDNADHHRRLSLPTYPHHKHDGAEAERMNAPTTATPARRGDLSRLIAVLQQHLPELKQDYHIKSLGLFGSYVRDEQTAESDLDVLVEFDEMPGLLAYVELQQALSDLLQLPVDLVHRLDLKPHIGERILAEVILV